MIKHCIIIAVIISLFHIEAFSEDNIPNKILNLREEAEKGISYFIQKDFSNCIYTLSNTIILAEEIIILLSKEIPQSEPTSISNYENIQFEESKSILITTLRKSTSKAIKNYIIGNIQKSIENIIVIKNISKSILDEAVISLNEINSKRELEKKLSSYEEMKELENKILKKSKSLEKQTYIYLTNFITNTKIITNHSINTQGNILLLIIPPIIFTIALLSIIFILKIKKRIEDISDLM